MVKFFHIENFNLSENQHPTQFFGPFLTNLEEI